MLVAVAVVPQTPLLVPEIAAGAAGELDALRTAAVDAVRDVTAGADQVVVLAPGPRSASYGEVPADFRAFGYQGADEAAGDDSPVRPGSALPLGAWLLDAAGVTLARSFQETDGAAVDVPANGRTALVVLADGSAKRDATAPGYVDERAVPYDAAIATALAAGDVDALATLDCGLAADLWASGVPALVSLASTTQATGSAVAASYLHHESAPYGVAYWVATWRL